MRLMGQGGSLMGRVAVATLLHHSAAVRVFMDVCVCLHSCVSVCSPNCSTVIAIYESVLIVIACRDTVDTVS